MRSGPQQALPFFEIDVTAPREKMTFRKLQHYDRVQKVAFPRPMR